MYVIVPINNKVPLSKVLPQLTLVNSGTMERSDLEQWRPRDVARLLALVDGQRRYFQEILASLPVGVLVLSADLEIVLANTALRRMFDLAEEGALHVRLESLLPAPVLDRIEQALKTRATDSGMTITTAAGQSLRIGIIPIAAWAEEGAREALITIEDLGGRGSGPAFGTGAGEFVPAQGRPAAGPAASAPAEIPAVVWALDPSAMRPIFVSRQAEKLLGLVTSVWMDRVHPGDRERVARFYQGAVASAGKSACEFRSLRADGQVMWLRDIVRPVRDAAGKLLYLAGITMDVTERRALEGQRLQRERLEALQKLASRMAHDLNNALMVLQGNAEEVLNGLPSGSEVRAEMEAVISSAERITSITGHLLAFGRRPAAVSEVLDLDLALNAATEQLGLQRKRMLAGSRVNANQAGLEQVLAAVAEAVRKDLQAPTTVTVDVAPGEIREDLENQTLPPGDYVVISIAASNAGPEADLEPGAFERFLPEKETADDGAIKLSQAYALVRQWGGDIGVAGTEAGPVFRIFLRRVGGTSGAGTPVVEQGEPPSENKPATILVVEDEAGIRALVLKFLQKRGYEVLEANNGEEALEILTGRHAPIDLLITDMVMPRMGGRELADRLRQMGRELKTLYISGYTEDTSVYLADLPAGNAFLQKPFTLSALLEKVRALLAFPRV